MHLQPLLHTVLVVVMLARKGSDLLACLRILLAYGARVVLALRSLLSSELLCLKLLNLLSLRWGWALVCLLALASELGQIVHIHESDVPEHRRHA